MEENCCNIRNAHHSEELKKNITKRLNRIEGQVKGIKKMVGEDTYCDDVLTQIASVKSALDGVGKLLLEAHIKSCVVEQIQEGDEQVIDELLTTIRRMMK